MLSAHYRSPLNFSRELMEASKNGLERIVNGADRLRGLCESGLSREVSQEEKKLLDQAEEYVKKFEAAMDDDFNTADAVAAIFELVKLINSNTSSEQSRDFLSGLLDTLTKLCDIMGIKTERQEETLDARIEKLIAQRQEARKERDFAKADQIRDQLLQQGILLEDTREGVKWKRI